MHRIPFLGIPNGKVIFEFPGLDEVTSARLPGRLPYAIAGAGFRPSSKTLETS